MPSVKTAAKKTNTKLKLSNEEIIADFKMACESREASLLGRKEVLTGKAKFGIFGDGKEVAQLAMARAFEPGDFRSGYYRDQTIMFAKGMSDVKAFFAQLYADTDVSREPASAGRQMNGHFATRSLNDDGSWKSLTKQYNSSADISPTAGQMARLVGLAYASKLYRQNKELSGYEDFSIKGNEVAFGTIGNASAAEGVFWEAINAGGVLMVPICMSIWDDGYGISVPNHYQMTKDDVGEVLQGFSYDAKKKQGYKVYVVQGWNYPALVETYLKATAETRKTHIPCIIHVNEMTQPQGHSTSGSHERYKSKERLAWEAEYDCIAQMEKWIVSEGITSKEECEAIRKEAKKTARTLQKEAFAEATASIKGEQEQVLAMFAKLASEDNADAINEVSQRLKSSLDIGRKTTVKSVHEVLVITRGSDSKTREELVDWLNESKDANYDRYNSHLYSESIESTEHVDAVPLKYAEDAPLKDGREILLAFFKEAFARDPRIFAIGEDVGKIGDVNQGLAGMQDLYGELRVTDTGIREATIVGQGIGASMRGLRPIVEIQYLDYLLYALQIMSDDLATVQYRSKGGQKAPLIIRTRGHRLEGIWHSGSPMGTIIGSFRGIRVCVPRNMTQAVGFYNTLLKSDEPGLIVERLNAYRLKEKLPENVGEYTLPLGIPEVLEEGSDLTIVTYGACVDIAKEGMQKLSKVGVSCELIDVQTLLPFDKNHMIVESLRKTNRVLFLDEDVPGGATAFMMQKVLEEQGGYYWLDSEPRTLAARPHRPAYGTDGDYFSKPNAEDVFDAAYGLMQEAEPERFPTIY